MRPLLPLLLLVAMASPALAEQPVKVTADKFVINEQANEAIFTGQVAIARKGLNVWADKVVIEYGAGGPQDITSFVATGHVRLKTPDQDATGERATFDPQTQILKISGNVTVVNSAGTLNGPLLTINLADNSSVFAGSKGGRVTGVFTPQ